MSRPKLEVAGLWTCRIRSTATRAEPAVVLMCRCPSRSWMTRMSTPCQAGGGRKSHRESQTEQIGKASGSRRAARGRAVGGTPTCGRGTGAQAARGDGARQSGGDLPARGGSARRAEVHQGPEQSTGRPQAFAGGAHLRDTVETAAQQILGNTVKAIALLASSRTPVLPNIATAAEQGFPETAITGWYALFFPKGTPEAIVLQLSNTVSATIDTPSVRERIESLGISAVTPEQRTPEHLAIGNREMGCPNQGQRCVD